MQQKEPSLLGAFIFHKKDLWKDSSKLILGWDYTNNTCRSLRDAPVRVPRLRKKIHKIHNTGLTRDGQPSFLVDRRRTMQAVSGLPSTCSQRSQGFLVPSFSTRRISGKTPRSWFQDETTQKNPAGLWEMPRYVYRGPGRIVTFSTKSSLLGQWERVSSILGTR
jgi:hypothetical protein